MFRFLKKLMIILLILIGIPCALWAYSRYIEPSLLTVHRESITAPDSVAATRVVYFSDTHFGTLYSQENLARIVDQINAQSPDVVVFGGDFIDNYTRDGYALDSDALSAELARIQATDGKYAVWGNHDYGGGAEWIYPDIMAAGGFTLLENTSEFLSQRGLRIVGYDDALLGHTDSGDYSLDNGDYNLILIHEPDMADAITATGGGLILSGHSHGGQVSLPFLTRLMYPEEGKKYTKGLYTSSDLGRSDAVQLYVSQGIGVTMVPYRFLNVPEIVVVDIN